MLYDGHVQGTAAGTSPGIPLQETPVPPLAIEPDPRISQLERKVQLLRLGAVGGLLPIAALAASAFTPRQPTVVRAERFELIDAKGSRQATLRADTAGIVLTLLDERGQPSASLRLTGEPWLAVETGHGREVAGLGLPRPRHLTE
jgi:hypothetical protein